MISSLPMFSPGLSLLDTHPVLSLHNYMTVPPLYCAFIILDEALYIVRLPCFSIRCRTVNTASAIPRPGIKPNCASLSLLAMILSQIFKVYQLYPCAIPTILDALLFINRYTQTISPVFIRDNDTLNYPIPANSVW